MYSFIFWFCSEEINNCLVIMGLKLTLHFVVAMNFKNGHSLLGPVTTSSSELLQIKILKKLGLSST